jgi:hypothetical protein
MNTVPKRVHVETENTVEVLPGADYDATLDRLTLLTSGDGHYSRIGEPTLYSFVPGEDALAANHQ